MKSKELFMLIDQIDKRFVEEAWEGDEEDGKVIEVVLERSPFHAIKFAVAVAACIALFGAGLFTIANIRINEPFLPDNSGAADSPVSSIESESSESTSSESSGISSEDEETSANDSVSTDNSNDEPIEEYDKKGIYELDNLYIGYGDMLQTKIEEKTDNLDYAVIYVDETNATEEHPLVVSIFRVDEYGNIGDPISEKIFITGRAKYVLYYTTPRGAGSPCILCLVNDFKETFDDMYDIKIVGSWTP